MNDYQKFINSRCRKTNITIYDPSIEKLVDAWNKYASPELGTALDEYTNETFMDICLQDTIDTQHLNLPD